MNRLSLEKRCLLFKLLCEGTSIRATARIAQCSINTVMKFLIDAGTACKAYQDKHLMNLPCTHLEVDEIWNYVYARDRKLPDVLVDTPGYGTVWTWVAICQETRLIPSWHSGSRGTDDAVIFLRDIKKRFKHKISIISDGHASYMAGVRIVFKHGVNHARLVKRYEQVGNRKFKSFVESKPQQSLGWVNPHKINTSYVERQNLSMRVSMERFARRTTGNSKKLANHNHALAMHFMHYNFVRIHGTLGTTPAVAAGVVKQTWKPIEVIELINE